MTKDELYTIYINALAAFEAARAERDRSDKAAEHLKDAKDGALREVRDLADDMESGGTSIDEYEAAANRYSVTRDAWHDATHVAGMAYARAKRAMENAYDAYLTA